MIQSEKTELSSPIPSEWLLMRFRARPVNRCNCNLSMTIYCSQVQTFNPIMHL